MLGGGGRVKDSLKDRSEMSKKSKHTIENSK
jgi:hypothetical protein